MASVLATSMGGVLAYSSKLQNTSEHDKEGKEDKANIQYLPNTHIPVSIGSINVLASIGIASTARYL